MPSSQPERPVQPERVTAAVRPPQQERSRRTLSRIAEAARALVCENGSDALTVQRVVERAGASVGSFYARFPEKEDLLRYVEDLVFDDVTLRWDQALAREDLLALSFQDAVERLVGLLRHACALGEAERHGLRSREGAATREHTFALHVQARAQQILLDHPHGFAHPNRVLATELVLCAVMGVLRAPNRPTPVGLGGPQPGSAAVSGLDEDRLTRELSLLCLSYLNPGGTVPEPGMATPVEYFDVWD